MKKFDVLHYLWQEFEAELKKDAPSKMKVSDWVSEKLSHITAEDWAKEFAKDSFYFELTYCFGEPDRTTVKWINGEHAFLYDQFLCEKHGILIITRDDYLNYRVGQTVFCPKCNEKILKPDKIFPLEYQEIEDKEMIKVFSNMGRKNRLHNRIDNLYYRTKLKLQRFFYSLKIRKVKNGN
jgi:hypothetical protein